MYRLAAGEEVKRFTAWKHQSPDGKLFGLSAGPGRRGAAKYCVLALYSWLQPPNPESKTRATQSAHCCAKPLPSIRDLAWAGWYWPVMASDCKFEGQGDHHTPRPLCTRRFANTSSAASLRTVLLKQGMATAATTTSWPSPAKAFACAPHATRGACWRRRHA